MHRHHHHDTFWQASSFHLYGILGRHKILTILDLGSLRFGKPFYAPLKICRAKPTFKSYEILFARGFDFHLFQILV